jgi:hypothetical protein
MVKTVTTQSLISKILDSIVSRALTSSAVNAPKMIGFMKIKIQRIGKDPFVVVQLVKVKLNKLKMS